MYVVTYYACIPYIWSVALLVQVGAGRFVQFLLQLEGAYMVAGPGGALGVVVAAVIAILGHQTGFLQREAVPPPLAEVACYCEASACPAPECPSVTPLSTPSAVESPASQHHVGVAGIISFLGGVFATHCVGFCRRIRFAPTEQTSLARGWRPTPPKHARLTDRIVDPRLL